MASSRGVEAQLSESSRTLDWTSKRPADPALPYDDDDDMQWFNMHLKADWKPA